MGTELLSDKVAVVTGVSTGIGWAIVKMFVEHGARVLGLSRREPPPAPSSFGDAFTFLQGDIAVRATVERLAEEASERHGWVDILVNNAALLPLATPLEDVADEEWDEVLQTNLLSVARLSAKLLPMMRASSAGRIINVGSVLSNSAAPLGGAYVVSKHALLGLTRTQALEYGPHGITANCLLPGAVDTAMFGKNDGDGEFRKYVEGKCPLRRVADPSEIAATVVFLASSLSSYVNGHALVADGGLTVGV